MSNPLLDKFEELYGKPKVETTEETKKEISGMDKLKEVVSNAMNNSISINQPTNHGLTISGGEEISEGDYVIPTATLTNGGITMNGSYITAPTLISNDATASSVTPNTFLVPQNTEVEKQFCKVMDDVAKKKAFVSTIRADIDTSFTGFGGQIKYTVEIIGNYP